jgi:hypothetical protein
MTRRQNSSANKANSDGGGTECKLAQAESTSDQMLAFRQAAHCDDEQVQIEDDDSANSKYRNWGETQKMPAFASDYIHNRLTTSITFIIRPII